MHIKGKYSWAKHLDFMIVDLAALLIAFFVSYYLKFSTLYNLPKFHSLLLYLKSTKGYPIYKEPKDIPNKEQFQGSMVKFTPDLDIMGEINLDWKNGYNGGTVTGGGTYCDYDGDVTLPPTPTRTGYSFAGWRVDTTQQGQSGSSQQTTP